VWVPSLAALRGTGLQSEYFAGLCRPWWHGWQGRDHAGLGGTAQLNRAPAELCSPWVHGLAEIVQGCAVLGEEGCGLAEIVNVCDPWPYKLDPRRCCSEG
jgi:hypothetical protein